MRGRKFLFICFILCIMFLPLSVYGLDYSVDTNVFGVVSLKDVSLPIFTIILGLIDGFNPCAMWILIFLITMMFSMKDRKKMWILGFTFIFTSGFVYLCFMLSWLSLASFLGSVVLVRFLISVFAVLFGMVNIHRFFKSLNSDIGCDVTNKDKRLKIMERIKKIVSEKSFLLSLLGIMILAFSVNLIELLCSLGIPVMFTNILAMNDLSGVKYSIYIGLYLIFFLIDDILVFVIAMKTLKIKGISNKYTKYSHLIGGIIMVLLGILMVLKPEWLMFNF